MVDLSSSYRLRRPLRLALLATLGLAAAVPLQPTFTSCINDYAPVAAAAAQLNVSAIYAELVSGTESRALALNGAGYDVLRVDFVGTLQEELAGYDNTTGKLGTSITTYDSTTWVCNSLFPSNLTTSYYPDNTTYCPLPAGDFALNLSIPLYSMHALTTLHTQVRVVDSSVPAQTLTCVDVHFTPYHDDAWYYRLFLWFPASLAIAYWITTWAARFAAGWVVGGDRTETHGYDGEVGKREARLRKWGTMVISGLSGERLGVSGALLRFATPSLRDIMAHIQFTTSLAMIAVSWPAFFYPIVSQGAWADLVWNVTLTESSTDHPSPYATTYTPPSAFQTQMTDSYYPLYLDSSAPNPLLDLYSTSSGMESFAAMVGLRPQDLFGTCIVFFLAITAAVALVSLTLWLGHATAEYVVLNKSPQSNRSSAVMLNRQSLGANSRASSSAKEWFDPKASSDLGMLPTQASLAVATVRPSTLRRVWARFGPKGEAGAFHFSAMYGNLLRLVLLFHLPITAFSIFQLTLGARASIVSRVFAAISFVGVSIVIPAFIMWRIAITPTGKLYEAARTLLSLGPAYNVYEQDRQLFRAISLLASLASGIVLGAGQSSGLAQAVVLIVIELAALITPTVWLPWGEGASMGAPMVFIGIIRVVSVVLAMLVSPNFKLSESVQQWLAYIILVLQAVVFVFFFFMVITKIVEGVIRLFGGAHFDESRHPLDGGLFAAIMDLDCLNGVRGGKAAQRKRRKQSTRRLQRNVSAAGSLTTQQILDRHSQGVPREQTPSITPLYPTVDPGSEAARRGTYFPVIPNSSSFPMSSPVIERLSFESRSEDRSDNVGHIMDAWRPGQPPLSQPPTPGSYAPLNPYVSPQQALHMPSIRVSQGDGHLPRPAHVRTQSSSAVVELGMPSAGAPSAGLRPDNRGLRPPALAIPKRRSLNNMRDDSPTSGSDSKQRKARGKARTARGAKARTQSRVSRHAWFSNTDSESDSEPGPSRGRRRPPQLDVDDEADDGRRSRGWRGLLGMRNKSIDELHEQARDENSARKAKAVNEMGALLAGVQPLPRPSAEAQSQPTTVRSFKVNRKTRPNVGQALPASSTPPTQVGEAAPADVPRSFRVKRPEAPGSTNAHRALSMSTTSTASVYTQASPTSASPTATTFAAAAAATATVGGQRAPCSPTLVESPSRGFRVIRHQASPTTASSGFVVNRPNRHSVHGSVAAAPGSGRDSDSSPAPPSTVSAASGHTTRTDSTATGSTMASGAWLRPAGTQQMGYPPSAFVTVGAGMERRQGDDAPARPPKNPRRSSEEIRG
ncbi:hypothetical protein Q5752_003508 [Cryptotrichosporon argae]